VDKGKPQRRVIPELGNLPMAAVYGERANLHVNGNRESLGQ
jgi:hypothetical protein